MIQDVLGCHGQVLRVVGYRRGFCEGARSFSWALGEAGIPWRSRDPSVGVLGVEEGAVIPREACAGAPGREEGGNIPWNIPWEGSHCSGGRMRRNEG